MQYRHIFCLLFISEQEVVIIDTNLHEEDISEEINADIQNSYGVTIEQTDDQLNFALVEKDKMDEVVEHSQELDEKKQREEKAPSIIQADNILVEEGR